MKWKLTLLIAIVIGAIGGAWVKNLPGFVIIAYDKTSYEMRLWIAAVLLLILVVFILFTISFIKSLFASAGKVRGWQGNRSWRRSRKHTIRGMLAFVEGRWKQAENTMVNAAKNSDTKLINYLVAAQAAQYQNAEDRRDSYLRLAHKAEPSADIAIGLTQAQLQLDNEQNEQALATLNELKQKTPNHPFILKLLCLTRKKLQDWNAIIELLPALKKQSVFNQQQLEQIEFESVTGLMQQTSLVNGFERLNKLWFDFPSSVRKKEKIIYCYVNRLIEFNQMELAEKTLKPLFKKQTNQEAIDLYGKIISNDGSKQFSFLESWLNSHPQSPNAIYLALGKIAYRISLWGKARHYLELYLRVEPSAEAFFMMAKTLDKLDDYELSMECYKQGLSFMVNPELNSNSVNLENGSEDVSSTNFVPKFEKD